jgi:predicted alpha/beta hydrolase family esterase
VELNIGGCLKFADMNRTTAIRRPSLALLTTEPCRAAFEFFSHALTKTPQQPHADGHPVIIFPGLASSGTAVLPLKRYCEALGYHAFDWGRGFNSGPKGDVDEWIHTLAEHTADLIAPLGRRATLIGWSLGGLYAREVAKLVGPQIRQVITIGTPFNTERDHSNVGWLFRLLSGTRPAFDAALSARLRTPPQVPTTSIFSRSDGVVAWQTCVHDVAFKQVEDIEVRGSHIGMGWNPAVLKVVADRLAQRPGRWKPHVSDRARTQGN